MAAKRQDKQRNSEPSGRTSRVSDESPLSRFMNSPRAKWVFFTIYLVITIFLFREFLFGDGMLFGGDTIPDGIYTRRYYKEYHAEHGGVPRWNPFVLGGLPFIDAMHGDTFYPGAWLKFFMPLTRALGHKLVWHVFLAGVMMYLFLRTLGVRRDASFLGGLMYMLAPSFVTLLYPGHDAKMYVIAWLPLAFLFLERGMTKPRLLWFAALGGVMGLLVLTSHAQMAYYSYWAIGLYFLFRLAVMPERTGIGIARRSSLFIAAVIIALTLGAVQLLPAYKFSTTQSVRTGAARANYEYATSWSLHPEEVAGMVVPSFQGNTFIDGRSTDMFGSDLYWGRNSFKLNADYHGILPLLFALLALLACRSRTEWFFAGLALLSLVNALGANTPLYRLFYALVPGVKTFRAPSMIIFMFCFAAVIMSARFLSRLLDRNTSLNPGDRRLWYGIAAIGGVALLITIMGRGFFDLWNGIFYRGVSEQNLQIMTANIPVFTSDMWRVAILACASLAGLWLFLSRKIGSAALVMLLALITFIDQAVVDARFITTIDPATYPSIAPDASVREIQARAKKDGHYRTLSLLPSLARIHTGNYYAMFGIEMADGFHNNELKSYELYRGGNRNFLAGWFDSYTIDVDGLSRNNWLKAAGVRYILAPTEKGIGVIDNTHALPRARVVHRYVTVPDDSAAVALLADAAFDPAVTVAIEEGGDVAFASDAGSVTTQSTATIEYTKAGAVIEADFAAPGFLVLSDNYVPYWRAFVDGEPVKIYRAYGTFMAIACGEGAHTIEFVYRSAPFETGKRLTLISLAFVVFAVAGSGAIEFVRKKRGEAQ